MSRFFFLFSFPLGDIKESLKKIKPNNLSISIFKTITLFLSFFLIFKTITLPWRQWGGKCSLHGAPVRVTRDLSTEELTPGPFSQDTREKRKDTQSGNRGSAILLALSHKAPENSRSLSKRTVWRSLARNYLHTSLAVCTSARDRIGTSTFRKWKPQKSELMWFLQANSLGLFLPSSHS